MWVMGSRRKSATFRGREPDMVKRAAPESKFDRDHSCEFRFTAPPSREFNLSVPGYPRFPDEQRVPNTTCISASKNSFAAQF